MRTLLSNMCRVTLWLCLPILALQPAAARESNVERWVDEPLSTYVAAQLKQFPRFKGASVQFVVMRDGRAVAEVSELALRLRDRLRQQLAGVAGVTVRTNAPRVTPTSDASACQAEAQYLIGLEVSASPSGETRVDVRALDNVEQTYVSGFRKHWRGRLNAAQRRQHGTPALDRTFLGGRSVPYSANETDLIAARLGQEIRCRLMQSIEHQYVLKKPTANDDASSMDPVTELVANHLSGTSTLTWVEDSDHETVNAVLMGKAHRVDEDLHQYWITLTPATNEQGLSPVGAAVYVRLPVQHIAAARHAVPQTSLPMPRPSPSVPRGTLLEPTALVRLNSTAACRAPATTIRTSRTAVLSCWALNVRTRADAVVFVLNHQQNRGLVRVGDAACRTRTTARVARADENTTIPLPADWLRNEWAPETRWEIDPEAETYYAIAVSDGKTARALAAQLDQLPQRCGASVRLGFAGAELTRWLDRLSASFVEWQPLVDWNAIRIKSVF